MNIENKSIPENIYNAIKKAEPLDCWEAYDEVWKNLKPIIQSESNKKAREVLERMIIELPTYSTFIDYMPKKHREFILGFINQSLKELDK